MNRRDARLKELGPDGKSKQFKDSKAYDLIARFVNSSSNELKLNVTELTTESETSNSIITGHVCWVQLTLETTAFVKDSPHYWKVPAIMWKTAYLTINGPKDFERELKQHAVTMVDEFANDYLKANPRDPKTPAQPKASKVTAKP